MRQEVLRYIREKKLMHAGDRVGVAVSAGADSVALLRVLLELRFELGIVLCVAHFNHQLRGEASGADQAFVASLAGHCDLEFFCGCGDVQRYALDGKRSTEAAARELRYAWLISLAESHKLNAIATGHTIDDQAETVLLKFLRGAGTRGLAGIYPQMFRSGTRQVSIVRPLLEVTRSEVEHYLTALGQAWREDESNLDHRFARNRVRHELLPLLEREYNPNLRHGLSDLAELSRSEEDYWRALVERELAARQSPKIELSPTLEPEPENIGKTSLPSAEADSFSETNGSDAGLKARSTQVPLFLARSEAEPLQRSATQHHLSLVNFQGLPLALQRRLLRRFAEAADLTLDFAHVEKLLRCALGAQPKTELPGGWLASATGDVLELRPPQLVRTDKDYEYILPIPGEISIVELGLTMRSVPVPQAFAIETGSPDALLCAELLGSRLIVRNWRPGDRFHPMHSGSEEKLKRLFSERHIPAEQRSCWPLVVCGSQVVWVRGFPVAQAFAWTGTRRRSGD